MTDEVKESVAQLQLRLEQIFATFVHDSRLLALLQSQVTLLAELAWLAGKRSALAEATDTLRKATQHNER